MTLAYNQSKWYFQPNFHPITPLSRLEDIAPLLYSQPKREEELVLQTRVEKYSQEQKEFPSLAEREIKYKLFKNRSQTTREECSLSLYRSWYLYTATFGVVGTYFAGTGESAPTITAGILCALVGAGIGVMAAISSRKAKKKIALLKEERKSLEEKLSELN